jgi:hypothetical protein
VFSRSDPVFRSRQHTDDGRDQLAASRAAALGLVVERPDGSLALTTPDGLAGGDADEAERVLAFLRLRLRELTPALHVALEARRRFRRFH